MTATSEDDSRDNLDTLSGESGEYQFDFPAPVELSTITLTGGETISAEVVGINSGGQSVEIAAGKDFVVVGNTRQADFSPATLNRVMVTFKGQPGAKLPRISLWQHQTTTQRDADSHLASVLKGDFRLPVYESDENAGLHLFNTGEKPLKLSITVKERKSGRLIFPTSYKTIPAGETKIEFPLADLPDGEYLVSIVNTDDGATMLRLLRRQLIPETLQPDILEMTGKKLLFPEDPAERLAFVFCLLMEFDNKTLDLGKFLQEYFYEDGSFYESFYAFCNQVIKPFRNAVKIMFTDSPEATQAVSLQDKERKGKVSQSVGFDVEAERKALYGSALADAKKVDGMLLLNALERAKDKSLRAALLCGYAYFARACGMSVSEGAVRDELEKIKEKL